MTNTVFFKWVATQPPTGCFFKWWYPHFTPQVLIIFSRKTPWKLLGKPTILGTPHIYIYILLYIWPPPSQDLYIYIYIIYQSQQKMGCFNHQLGMNPQQSPLLILMGFGAAFSERRALASRWGKTHTRRSFLKRTIHARTEAEKIYYCVSHTLICIL